MDKKQSEEGRLILDDCCCGRGKLHKGFTKDIVEIKKEVVVISNVPAWLCDLCDEAYISPGVSEKIDEMEKSFRSGKLLAKPLAVGQVELKMNARATRHGFEARLLRKIIHFMNNLNLPS